MITILLIITLKFLIEGIFNSIFYAYFRAKEKYDKKEKENDL